MSWGQSTSCYSHQILLHLASHLRHTVVTDEHIDLGPHSHFSFKVYSRFNRETGPWHHLPLIFCLKVIDIHAVAVNFLTD